ncbi:MAG: 30S ribosomal protein S12 methylthiotransferase RimO [Saprospiraceae bacterium]|nr:30S ribosomal protein S12 methylthiotransferase RimO [Saprospiraceae bacterium]
MKTKGIKKNNVNVITLGCSKNLVDSENIITQLKANDIEVHHESSKKTDTVIVNTCGFIDLAKQESIDTILQYAKLKKKGKLDKLYVTGCLSQRYKDALEVEIPEVDAFFGTMELPSLLAKLNADYKHELIGERIPTTPMHYAYIKIAEGCNRTCSFCAIPLMRGGHVSRTIEDIAKEAKHLVGLGVKEVMLIAQELTYYGLDLYKKRALADLLKELSSVEGLVWIRLHYAYPHKFPMDVLDAINDYPKVCKYLDIPLQHASDSVLFRMKRQITKKETETLVKTIREKVPGIAIRTTFLVGFPGETEEEFQELMDFVREMRLDRVGVFKYSHEEDTSAHAMEDDVPEEIKEERAAAIMSLQEGISLEKNQTKIGKVFKVLIDRKEGGYYYGRTEFDSPEVDNEVLINAGEHYSRVGDFADIKITEAEEHDLYGTFVG